MVVEVELEVIVEGVMELDKEADVERVERVFQICLFAAGHLRQANMFVTASNQMLEQ